MRVPRILAVTLFAACTSKNPPGPDAHVSDAHDRATPVDAPVIADAPPDGAPQDAGIDAPPDAPPDATIG